jgi:hypothetical protein
MNAATKNRLWNGWWKQPRSSNEQGIAHNWKGTGDGQPQIFGKE